MATAMMLVGHVYACIAGDHRYGTRVEVHSDGRFVELRLIETNPNGGMDGPGGTTTDAPRVMERLDLREHKVAEVVRRLRRGFKVWSHGVVAQYGATTKNFTWRGQEGYAKGLSVALAAAAIRGVRS